MNQNDRRPLEFEFVKTQIVHKGDYIVFDIDGASDLEGEVTIHHGNTLKVFCCGSLLTVDISKVKGFLRDTSLDHADDDLSMEIDENIDID